MSRFENYAQFKGEMILRDYLARDRTILANERTFLAYVRTFVGFMGSGAGLIKLFGDPYSVAAGIVLIAISPLFLIVGGIKYVLVKKKLSDLVASARKKEEEGETPCLP